VNGRTLIEAEGWAGRVYWGYGDAEQNTGPIQLSAYDPMTATWHDLLTFDSEQVFRFRRIGAELWIPAADPRVAADYAVGTADHAWTSHDIGPSLHVMDVVERVPGEVFLVGSDDFDGVPGGDGGGAIWRSIDAGQFVRLIPDLEAQTWDPTTFWFGNAGAIAENLYASTVGSAWVFDGKGWSRGPDLAGFVKPIAFAETLVFQAFGQLWSFDGTRPRALGIDVYEASWPVQGVYEAAEDRLVVVTPSLDVLLTGDLSTWTCIGKAPVGVASVGILDRTVYFGAAEAELYAYESPSW
jgi:hypothetical protein